MTRPVHKYNFRVKFVCKNPKCQKEARLVQFVRHWNFIETFASEDAGTILLEQYKPEIVNFRCSACGENITDSLGHSIEGRKRMYNWLFANGMLRTESGGVVNSSAYRFTDADLEVREIPKEVPDEQCDPALLP